jgi:hypothetical protein
MIFKKKWFCMDFLLFFRAQDGASYFQKSAKRAFLLNANAFKIVDFVTIFLENRNSFTYIRMMIKC